MSSISQLRSTLLSVLNTNSPQTAEQELYLQLMANKPALLAIFDVGKRNQQEQREVESGEVFLCLLLFGNAEVLHKEKSSCKESLSR